MSKTTWPRPPALSARQAAPRSPSCRGPQLHQVPAAAPRFGRPLLWRSRWRLRWRSRWPRCCLPRDMGVFTFTVRGGSPSSIAGCGARGESVHKAAARSAVARRGCIRGGRRGVARAPAAAVGVRGARGARQRYGGCGVCQARQGRRQRACMQVGPACGYEGEEGWSSRRDAGFRLCTRACAHARGAGRAWNARAAGAAPQQTRRRRKQLAVRSSHGLPRRPPRGALAGARAGGAGRRGPCGCGPARAGTRALPMRKRRARRARRGARAMRRAPRACGGVPRAQMSKGLLEL
jgi:hypothetical protein